MSNPQEVNYIAPFEVVVHNKPYDCWVSFLGKVFDVTPVIKEYEHDVCTKPLLAHAGKDISNWFDERTGEIMHYVHPVTGALVPYCPHGTIPDVKSQVPSASWRPVEYPPWWKDNKLQVGVLTKRVRPIRIVNTLICKEVTMNVCCEDTFKRILERYSIFSSAAKRYTWTHLDKKLDMNLTMEENGIPDERDKFVRVGLPQSTHVPGILLYFNDDLGFDDSDCEEDDD